MIRYKAQLKHKARQLRKNMTESERVLWSRLRGKQLLGVQFYRQKPIGKYIVDFYAPRTKLVVEVDGSQHMEGEQVERDEHRDEYLASVGLRVLRFNSTEVVEGIDGVAEFIYRTIAERLNREIPLDPPLRKGEDFDERSKK
ncbi:MAG: endonuclease domain-containing protein [Syntrophobacteria bacterium]